MNLYNDVYNCDNSIKEHLSNISNNFIANNSMVGEKCTTCSGGKNGNTKLLPIMDPKFNLREVAKHLILLEDHLFHKGKRCPDCILKHCYTIDAFLDEGITLDKEMKYIDTTLYTQDQFKNISKSLENAVASNNLTDDSCCKYAQQLRKLRKPLVKLTANMNLNY